MLQGVTPAGAARIDVMRWVAHDYYVNEHHLIVSPKVTVDLIPEAFTQAIIRPRSAILHSNAAPAFTLPERLVTYWRRSDITGEGHFDVAGGGLTRQAMPLNRKADCNYKANGWWRLGQYVGAVSFETTDNGYPTLDVTPWTLDQLADMVGILTNLAVCYGVACTNPTRWDDAGIGHHCQYPEWSSYTGKTCPGAARIRQMDYVRQAVAGQLAEYGRATGWQCGKGYPT